MDGDWDLYAIVKGTCPINDASSSSSAAAKSTITTTFLPTTTPTIPVNNGQMSDGITDWDLNAIVKASSSSLAAVIPTITTTPTIREIKSQDLDGIFDCNLDAMFNGLYPTIGASSSSITATNTIPIMHTTTTTTPTTSLNVYNPQKSSFQGEMSNQRQLTNEDDVIKEFMQISKNPLNVSNKHKPPLSSKNWPILYLPCFGKLPKSSKKHQLQQQNQLQGRQQSLQSVEDTSKSKKRQTDTKRIYKMPPQGLNTDVWSWKKYGEKFIGGSPYPRKYYKCNSTSDCEAKRRVERNRSDPKSYILTYTGHHNHPMPLVINYADNSTNNNPNSSEDRFPAATESLKKKEEDDDVFEGLGNFIDL